MTARIIKQPNYHSHSRGYRSAYHVKIDGIIDYHKYINMPVNKTIKIILGRIR
ncbi:hypothetical protein LCGC14_0406690 [marine sediment metagenome]|uniref:Uncharacterized protein n=1 Tax=marine sediment metagenome TaxID=412755 RepID=A0A0F9T0P2_9ZZZZ